MAEIGSPGHIILLLITKCELFKQTPLNMTNNVYGMYFVGKKELNLFLYLAFLDYDKTMMTISFVHLLFLLCLPTVCTACGGNLVNQNTMQST